MRPHVVERGLHALLWAALAAYGLLVVRDFFQYADRAVYLALDDGLANQAYVLATHGRYGFLSSPTLYGVPRHWGEVSYGPWYFFVAGGLAWVFGFSLTLVRSVHLWIVVATVAGGAWWFRGPHRVAAAATLGLMAFYCFSVGMWPMARPDSMVSAFAILLVICAGQGLRTGKARFWLGAGLAASCGTFAHLIAWSLVPVCLALFGLWAVDRVRGSADPGARRAVLIAFAGLAAGGILGAVMFYGSFQFRIADQIKMFDAYVVVIESQATYWDVLTKHFTTAFDYLPPVRRWLVAAMLALAAATAAAGVATRRGAGRTAVIYLLPPVLVWAGYLLSGGLYTNHHKGYAILNQILAAWTAAALVWTWLDAVTTWRPRAGRAAGLAATLVLLAQAGDLLAWHVAQAPLREQHANRWVSITDHTKRLLAPIPAGATAWGPVMYGIETPDRIQLVQVTEGMVLMPRVPDAPRPLLYPDFLIWGYPEVRDNALAVVQGVDSLLNQVLDVLPGAEYRLASIVAADPYGINRVYARVTAAEASDALPQVSIYDAPARRWLSRLGPPVSAGFTAAAPARVRLGYSDDTPSHTATNTVESSLPPGRYLLRVTIRPGRGHSRRRMLAATSAPHLDQTIGELGPDGDFAGYWLDQTTVVLLSLHPGGPLYINQFDNGDEAAIEQVEVFPVLGLLDPEEMVAVPAITQPLPAWTPLAGVRPEATADGAVRVTGNGSFNGYQVMSGPIAADPRTSVAVTLDLTVDEGAVCTGVLNGPQATWLVPPDRLRQRLEFTVDESGAFHVVVANCHATPGEWPASRFRLGAAEYAGRSGAFYTDRLMSEVFGADLRGPR